MSIIHAPSILPPPADRSAELARENQRLRSEVDDLREQLRLSNLANERDAAANAEVRRILQPLYSSLQYLFEQIETTGVGVNTGRPTPPQNSAVWDSWKQRMGANSAAAKIIDMLMLHGELTQAQMRIHLGTNRMQTVYDACSKLNKAQLLNKNGDKFSLKQI